MNWKFWKENQTNEKRETTLKITKGIPSMHIEYYVCAQSPKEAKNLLKELQKDENI